MIERLDVLFRLCPYRRTTCQKMLDGKLQLKLLSKAHADAWNVSSTEPDSSQKEPISSNSGLPPSITALDDPPQLDADSSVSEKVLMATVAESKIMNRANVSVHTSSPPLLFRVVDIIIIIFDDPGKRGEGAEEGVHKQVQVLPENVPQTERPHPARSHAHGRTAVQVRSLQQELRGQVHPGLAHESSHGQKDVLLPRLQQPVRYERQFEGAHAITYR